MLQDCNEELLVAPFGGKLVNLLAPPESHDELRRRAAGVPQVQLTQRNLCDLELLATGAFSPLDNFMGEADYRRVVEEMRLANGVLFPIPVTLPVEPPPGLKPGDEVALTDQGNNLLALMRVDEMYEWDLTQAVREVFGTIDSSHPLVAEMHSTWGRLNLSGELRVISLPHHYDFRGLRLTPAQVRERLAALGRRHVVAFQTRNPLHRAHEEMTKRAAEQVDGTLLLHPVVGMTKPGDIDYFTRVRSYAVLAESHYDPRRTVCALLPLAMRMAGPREAVWHAIIRRNYGASHFIVGRDHASPGRDSGGRPFYGPYDAQEMLKRYRVEIGVELVPFTELVYLPDEDRYEEESRVPVGKRTLSLSGTALRESLQEGWPVPDWLMQPAVAKILAQAHPPRHRQGFCVWFTGLSAAGKSTTAEVLTTLLLEQGRRVTVLDGDVVRTHLSRGLGFSREDRDVNVRRIGFVAAEIVRHGGAVVAAAISPYRATRDECRDLVGAEHFIEIYVDTPLEVCEQRDPKGMYSLARSGKIKEFTGVDDPYEPPPTPEIALDTVSLSAPENAQRIMSYLTERGYLR